jgi:hypothetical protein
VPEPYTPSDVPVVSDPMDVADPYAVVGDIPKSIKFMTGADVHDIAPDRRAIIVGIMFPLYVVK